MIELQSIWIEERFSTGDAIARDDALDLMRRIWALLPLASDRSATYNPNDIDYLADAGEYEQLGALFFGDAESAYAGDIGTFDLNAFRGAELWKLHEVQSRKKLLAADELRQAKNQTESLPSATSPSSPAATATPTPSPTSSMDSENAALPFTNNLTPTPLTP
ncbi:MAG: hypothetical protein AAF609_15025 [Cyanobacteria bacterium P01_C01_bin.120]